MYLAALEPLLPALWTSDAATDSGNGNSGSSTITRRISETKSTPSTDPTSINAVDFQYASRESNDGHAFAKKNAGSVNTAPAATDSPIEPAVRAMFSSRIDPFQTRSTAMLMTAA